MQLRADAVTHIVADHAVAEALGVLLHGMADIGDAVTHAGKFDALEEALPRDLNQLECIVRALADRIGSGAVAVVALELGADVDADDVALAEHTAAGNSVDDFFVDRNARAGGKAAVVQEGGRGARLRDELVHLTVDLSGGHAGLDHLPGDASRPGSDLAGLTHKVDFSRGFNDNHSIPRAFLMTAVVCSMVS